MLSPELTRRITALTLSLNSRIPTVAMATAYYRPWSHVAISTILVVLRNSRGGRQGGRGVKLPLVSSRFGVIFGQDALALLSSCLG
jgi:hypothetical protein